jgi:hypothetical protein
MEKAHARSVENLGGVIKTRMHDSISSRFSKANGPKAGASVANQTAADRVNATSGLGDDPLNSGADPAEALQSKQEPDDYSQRSSAGLARLSPPPVDAMIPTLDYEDFVPKKEECL